MKILVSLNATVVYACAFERASFGVCPLPEMEGLSGDDLHCLLKVYRRAGTLRHDPFSAFDVPVFQTHGLELVFQALKLVDQEASSSNLWYSPQEGISPRENVDVACDVSCSAPLWQDYLPIYWEFPIH